MIRIDASQNPDGVECTIQVVPDLFCMAKNGWWNEFFEKFTFASGAVLIISFIYNLKSLICSDNPLDLGTFGKIQILIFALMEFTDMFLDINAAVNYPWSRSGFKVIFIFASVSSILVFWMYKTFDDWA